MLASHTNSFGLILGVGNAGIAARYMENKRNKETDRLSLICCMKVNVIWLLVKVKLVFQCPQTCMAVIDFTDECKH